MTKVRKIVQLYNEISTEVLIKDFLEVCSTQGNTKDTLNSHRYALQA